MSEGSITYMPEGGSCGIFSVINSQLRNHKVCDDELACTEQYFDSNQNVTIKKCEYTGLAPGAICNPLYRNCVGNLDCLKNENEDFTCGGCIFWDGNDEAIDTTKIVTTKFNPNLTLVIIGIILVLFDLLCYLYVFHYKNRKNKKMVYEKTSLVSDESIY